MGEYMGRAARLGQDLFYPPNVGGWPAGRSWLTTRSVIGRANYAAALVEGARVGRPGAVDLAGADVRAGLVGRAPSLLDLDPVHGDLKAGSDFRQVYASVLEDWLGLSAPTALAGKFELLSLFGAS